MTTLTNPVYMLAIDHRWQWEKWCDEQSIDRARIAEVKELAAGAFLQAREQSDDVRQSGALLVDVRYGRAAFDLANEAGATTGNPAEQAGVFPLAWTDVFDAALPGSFVKVLVRHRPDITREVVDMQLAMLRDLQSWCRDAHKPLVVEVLVSAATEDASFEREGRPRILADYIRNAYRNGLVPEYWKIEGVPDTSAMAIVDGAILEEPGPLQLILGKGAGIDTVQRWFASARGARSAAGFAIGRTVYWEPACDFLLGRASADEATARIAGNYATVISLWRGAR